MFKEAVQTIQPLGLDKLSKPRTKKVPKRFAGLALSFTPDSVSQYYKIEYLKLIDVAIRQLSDRIIECPGLIRYCELENVLLTGKFNKEITQQYPELESEGCAFQVQLDMFHSHVNRIFPARPTTSTVSLSLSDCCDALRNMR